MFLIFAFFFFFLRCLISSFAKEKKVNHKNKKNYKTKEKLNSSATKENYIEIQHDLKQIVSLNELACAQIILKKKLDNLYKGKIYLLNSTDNYVN